MRSSSWVGMPHPWSLTEMATSPPVWLTTTSTGPSGGRVLDGVGDEVGQDLLHPELLGVGTTAELVTDETELPPGPGAPVVVDDAPGDDTNVDVGCREVDMPVLDLRGLEQVDDEALEPLRLPEDRLHGLAPLLLVEQLAMVEQRAGPALDGGQRRAQLVGDGRHELRPKQLELVDLGDVASVGG